MRKKSRDVICREVWNKIGRLTTAYRFKACLLLAVIVSCCLPPAGGAASDGGNKQVYVIHHFAVKNDEKFPVVTALIEFLSHFDLTCREIAVSEWSPGDLKDAEFVVYLGKEQAKVPKKLLAEMATANRVIWFERNIEQMAKYLKWRDFEMDGVAFARWRLDCAGKEIFYGWQEVVMTQPGLAARTIATLEGRNFTKPLVWQRDNIYFCGAFNSEREFMYPLGILLHELIPNEHSHSQKALLKIEYISPLAYPPAVAATAAAISKYNIPFAISVIPVGVEDNKYVYLHERPELVRVLKEAEANGASIIMHGYSHQNEYSPTTGEGYEFWNSRDNKPMADDAAFTAYRLESGIAELVRCGLTPVAFSAPRHAMSKTGYNVLSRYFNIFSGQLQISDVSSNITMTLPYITKSAYLNGMVLIPENSGSYSYMPSAGESILLNFEKAATVPDGLASFIYHYYFQPESIIPIIEGIVAQGYEFLDIRLLPVSVKTPQLEISGADGQFEIKIIDEKLKTLRESQL